MNLNQLRYVKAVAETKKFTLAAEKCCITQPTLSNGIRQLEQEFEERIFKRTTRSVVLTPFGVHILPFIDNILKANEDLTSEVRNFVHPSCVALRIGISPLINSEWLSSMLEKFKQANTEVEVILHEQNMADLYQTLDDGILDLVFGVIDTWKTSWGRAPLYREQLYFIPRGDNYPESKKSVSFEQIAEETFVMVPNTCGLARATRALFRKKRKKLNEYSGKALSYQILEQWASLGLGAAILPKSKIVSSKQTAYALTNNKGDELIIDFEAVWQTNIALPKYLQQFMQFFMEDM